MARRSPPVMCSRIFGRRLWHVWSALRNAWWNLASTTKRSCANVDNTDAWLHRLADTSWDEIYRKSGTKHAQIDEIATKYAMAKNVVFSWTMGITHHSNGVQNVQAIANLALLRGMVGRPNAGLMPIRGHSKCARDWLRRRHTEIERCDLRTLGAALQNQAADHQGPRHHGLHGERAIKRQLRTGFCLGGNLYGSNPDATFAGQSLSQLDQIVYLNTTLNTGHAHGLAKETIILPVLARDEEPEPTTRESIFRLHSPFRWWSATTSRPQKRSRSHCHRGRRGARSPNADRLELDAAYRQDSRRHEQVIPGFEQIREIDKNKQEFQIPGRTFHQTKFPTPSGKAMLHAPARCRKCGARRGSNCI